MSSSGDTTVADVSARAARRLTAIDPLLPDPAEVPAGCDATFIADRTAGPDRPAAIGFCDHWAGEPESIALSFGAARRFRLIPRIAGPDTAQALDHLLDQWRDHLAGVPAADGDDTSAGVVWPSRDVAGIRTLLRHGMAPRAVVGARITSKHGAGQAPSAVPGIVIRRAGPADIEAVVSLCIELIRYDEHFGSLIQRPSTHDCLRRDSADLLAGPEPWIWLAEHDGIAVGLLTGLRPAAATWIAPMTRARPVAYLQQGFVSPTERGQGIGAMLTAAFHAELESAGVAVALLDYSQNNPLSTSFWNQQGYRPLWTNWEARPARTLR
jgi:GNAT superfamily N-acetyltransferase